MRSVLVLSAVLACTVAATASCGSSTDTSSASSTSSSSNASEIDAVCKQVAGLDCRTTAEECTKELTGEAQEAMLAGCGAEVDAVLACAARNPSTCKSKGTADEEWALSSACSDELLANEHCLPRCDGSSSAMGCNLMCNSAKVGQFGATCTGSGPFTCACSGPKNGKTFQLAACEVTDTALYSNCL